MGQRPPPRVLLLDVMDCLVHDPFYAEVLDFFGMSLEELFAVKSKSAWIDFECGRLSEAQFARRYFDDGRPLDLAGLKATMRAAYRLLPGIADLLDDLRAAGHSLHALSNYPRWYTEVEAATKVSRWLRWSFVSCKTGRRKPQAEAFVGASRSLGLAPQACTFVDDRAKNCEGARAVEMSAIHFKGAVDCRAQLMAQGWLAR